MNQQFSKKVSYPSLPKKTPIIGYLEYKGVRYPIIQTIPRVDLDFGQRFWCEFCRRYHLHGEGGGHRAAHCSNPLSPFLLIGYILRMKQEAQNE